MDWLDRFDQTIARVEGFLLAVTLSTMIVLAFLQIVLRNFFATGLSWGDPMIRYLVLWAGFTGAALATREGKHIRIDVFSQWVPGLGNRIIQMLTNVFSFFICGVLTYAAGVFIKNEAQMGAKTFFDIPLWIPQIIIPLCFGLMAIRYGFRSLGNLSNIRNPGVHRSII